MIPERFADDLILGLLDTSESIADRRIADRCRALTLDWSRFKYSGPVVESAELGELLERAGERDRRWCFVQSYGHVLAETWSPDADAPGDALSVLARWQGSQDEFVAAAHRLDDGRPDRRCLLVDLPRWRAAGRPRLLAGTTELAELPPELHGAAVYLSPEDARCREALASLFGDGIESFAEEDASQFEAGARRFLARVRRLAGNLRRGVFLWNIESYADVDRPPADFGGPLQSLYSVAAGLKPNRILETHGFDASTRVIFYDYSEPGLRFRKLLLDEWGGRDYPGFLRRLFRLLPTSEAFYCLWEGVTPETLDWQQVEERWRREVEAWGGAEILARHWARYRRLPHEFVHCDLLGDPSGLIEHLRDESRAATWWSNAFFSFVSNWYHLPDERRVIFRRWIDALADAAPRLLLYGASSDNVSVNSVRAAEYRSWLAGEAGDELEPGKLHGLELRF